MENCLAASFLFPFGTYFARFDSIQIDRCSRASVRIITIAAVSRVTKTVDVPHHVVFHNAF